MAQASPQEKAAFIFRYFMERSHGRDDRMNYHCTHLTAIPTWDDGMDFAVDFRERFPGRKPDPNHELASVQLIRVLKQLCKDGWMARWRLGNEDGGRMGTPKWQYIYQLPQWLINDLKKGILTPETAATAWGGEWTPLEWNKQPLVRSYNPSARTANNPRSEV